MSATLEQVTGFRGPGVFAYLADDESLWLPPAERDDLALALRAAFRQVT